MEPKKCIECENAFLIGTKHEKSVCASCKLRTAVDELIAELEKSKFYRLCEALIKRIDEVIKRWQMM